MNLRGKKVRITGVPERQEGSNGEIIIRDIIAEVSRA